MRLRDVGFCLVGGTVLYVTMAACSGHSATPGGSSVTVSSGTHPGGGVGGHGGGTLQAGAGGHGGTPPIGTGDHGGSGQSGSDGGLVDALTDPVPSASADGGSRLKPRFFLGDDGAKQYLSNVWFDSQRNEDCSFTVGGDGKQRCLPQGAAFNLYADAACATAIVFVEAGCTAPEYALSKTDSTCGGPSQMHVFSVGAATTPSAFYTLNGASCQGLGPAPTTGYLFFPVGAEIPASSFVGATLGHD